ncbi:hypothetical protein [Pseudomonas sp. M5]|uniref:hypothetical protein n=1 Tax=Pseudomonas sp. M5 TaxID=1620788 RepID=UPI00195B87CD|nr:hypothetical protein [Pseudomonas sp. M5]MBM7397413.1 hypothetical protein [Pseudomonas sp. M5]HDS1756196.1 hypothetical protein [Pseudomonas putida]
MNMWNLSLNRKDFIELWLGGSRNTVALATVQPSGTEPDNGLINLQWDSRPSAEFHFPDRLIASDEDLKHIFTALNSTPAAATPVSAYTRVLSLREHRLHAYKRKSAPLELAPFIAMTMAEAALHIEDKSNWRNISLSKCTKTLSYAWTSALDICEPNIISDEIPVKWYQTYMAVNSSAPRESLRKIITAATEALNSYLRLTNGSRPSGYPETLAEALYRKDKKSLNSTWLDLTKQYGIDISLENLMLATREERASYLQQAIKYSITSESNSSTSALCAFIATQVAPGSLEHLDLLRNTGRPEIVFWYAMYAALLTPEEILGAMEGLGYRIYRLIKAANPTNHSNIADICYAELKVLERGGMDAFLKKTSAARELKVELVPYVCVNFDYSSAQQQESPYERGRRDHLEYEYRQANRLINEYRARIDQAMSMLSGSTNEVPDGYPDPYGGRRGYPKKKSIDQ